MIVGCLFLGLGVFVAVYDFLYIYYVRPDMPAIIWGYGIVSAIVGLVLIRSYSRAEDDTVRKKKGV
jgi:hypothetical protein